MQTDPSSSRGSAGSDPKPLLIRALQGEVSARPPIWLMRQAGRYLPEYREVRAQAGSFMRLCYTPELAAEVTLQPIRRFGFDASILFADILLIPDALGQTVEVREGEGPVLTPLADPQAVAALRPGGLHEHLAPVYETVRILRRELPADVALIGFAGAPWTVATYMIEGGTSVDHARALRWASEEPDGLQRLIDLLVESSIEYLLAQVRAGADAIQIFDTWAGRLPEPAFVRFCLAPAAAIVAGLRAEYPDLPVIGFPRGVGDRYRQYAVETGVSGISIDSTVELAWARDVLQPVATVQGNLDPQILVAGGDEMRAAANRILETLGHGPFVFNLGHGIVPQTPPEHVAELVELVQSWRA